MKKQEQNVGKIIRRKLARPVLRKDKIWILRIARAAEIFSYLLIQLSLTGLLVYEIVAYIIYKVK